MLPRFKNRGYVCVCAYGIYSKHSVPPGNMTLLFLRTQLLEPSIVQNHLAVKANDHLDATKLTCLHLSLASTSADVLLEFHFGVNKCNHRSIWGQGGEETAEEAVNPCSDQASFPTISCEDKGIWKSASPANAEDTLSDLHRMSALLTSIASERIGPQTQNECQCCLSR